MDEIWTVSADDAAGTVTLTLRAGPRPLRATLTEAEMAAVADVLPDIAAATRRGEFSRIRLGAAFREAIGRDPFKQVAPAPAQPESFNWWLRVAYIAIALTFAANHSNWWLRLLGYGMAAATFGDIVSHVRRRRRGE